MQEICADAFVISKDVKTSIHLSFSNCHTNNLLVIFGETNAKLCVYFPTSLNIDVEEFTWGISSHESE